jgi:acetyl-CoA carboxylase biotin carboxyl carrier protein
MAVKRAGSTKKTAKPAEETETAGAAAPEGTGSEAADADAATPGATAVAELAVLIDLMSRHDLEEVEFETTDLKARLRRRVAAAPAAHAAPAVHALPLPPAAPAMLPPAPPSHLGPAVKGGVAEVPAAPAGAAAGEAEKLVEIRSPMVGTFYAAPGPDLPPYTGVGKDVEPDTVVCIIEAMKVMNEIKAEVAGGIVKVLAKNGQPVEFNTPLFAVKPK